MFPNKSPVGTIVTCSLPSSAESGSGTKDVRSNVSLTNGLQQISRQVDDGSSRFKTASPISPLGPDASIPDLLHKVEAHVAADQILAAARTLRQIEAIKSIPGFEHTKSFIESNHQRILDVARHVEKAISDLSEIPDPTCWTRREELHNKNQQEIIIHYHLDPQLRLQLRIHFLIEKALLVPLLAVLIETDLYNTWVPRWRFPPVGVTRVHKLGQTGRTNQVILVDLEMPMKRDVVLASVGVDDIDELGLIAIYLGTCQGEYGVVAPPPIKGTLRIDFEGCFVFQKFPSNHPVLQHVQQRDGFAANELILVGFTSYVDGKVPHVFPQVILNFILGFAIGKLFGIFLAVAEEVRSGERPAHTKNIESKRDEIYNWVEERIQQMKKPYMGKDVSLTNCWNNSRSTSALN